MNKLVLGLAIAAVLLALCYGVLIAASEVGEVVVLTTRADDGETRDTRLWVVNDDGSAWVRAGAGKSGWLERLRANPKVKVLRDGVSFEATAVPSPAHRDRVNALMRRKYGHADRLIGFVFGRDRSVPVRLRETEPGG